MKKNDDADLNRIQKTLSSAIYGLTKRVSTEYNASGVRSYLTRPPTDLTRLTLQIFFQEPPVRDEKSEWRYDVTFEGVALSIADWKGAFWSIWAPPGSNPSGELLDRLEKRILKASSYLYKAILPQLHAQVDEGIFYVVNSYSPIHQMYDFLRLKLQTLLDAVLVSEKTPIQKKTGKTKRPVVPHWEPRNSIELSAQCIAATALFFSYLDVLIDISFMLFSEKKIHYLEFRRLEWKKRVLMAIGDKDDKSLLRFIDELEIFKAKIRDSALHGVADHFSIIVPYARKCLVPVSTRGKRFQMDAVTPNVYWPFTDAKKVTEEALSLFTRFDSMAAKNRNLSLSIVYGQEVGMLTFAKEDLKKIKKRMKDPESFAEHLSLLAEEAEARRGY